jgi:hypothetical protein
MRREVQKQPLEGNWRIAITSAGGDAREITVTPKEQWHSAQNVRWTG